MLKPKHAKTYREQVAILTGRGLTVNDPASAEDWLRHHNYYRFSAYRFPFTLPGDPDKFVQGVTFEQLSNLYRFDAGLRQLVFDACGKVEISVRARWAYETGHQLGPLGYLNNQHFNDPLSHARALNGLAAEMQRSNEEFIRHHQETLKQPWPPAWVVSEIASFGSISKLLANMKSPRLRQDIADTYNLDEKAFCSLIHHFSVLRNLAAHHARIWNRRLTFTVQLPRKKPADLAQNFYTTESEANSKRRKLYNSLVLLLYMIQEIEPAGTWPSRLLAHLRTLDPKLIPDMGFPANWNALPIWRAIPRTADMLDSIA